MSNNWEDQTLKTAQWVHGAVDFFMAERAQLYGTLIYLMISNGISEMQLPSPTTFNSYGKDYYILFKVDDGEGKVYLKERPEEDE